MTADDPPFRKVVPFPLALRRALVRRLAARMIAKPAKAAEQYLEQQIRRQKVALSRKGIPEDIIECEVRTLEGAIRGELWRQVLIPDDAA